MGYGHHWGRPREIPSSTFQRVLEDVRRIVDAVAPTFGLFGGTRLTGATGQGRPLIDGEQVCFNGSPALEAFWLPRDFAKKYPGRPPHEDCLYWDAVKTDQLPYDRVVVATLASLKYHVPDVRLRSDGSAVEWEPGLELFRTATAFDIDFATLTAPSWREQSFGPFAPAFEVGQLECEGHMLLLWLDHDGTAEVFDRIEKALAAGDPVPWVRALFAHHWRPHLVGALALFLDDDRRCDTAGLWAAIEAGSWVTPQLVATAYCVDRDFADHVRRLVAASATVTPPGGLSPMARHVETGPAGVGERSAKLMASLVAVGRLVPSLTAWLGEVCADPEVAALLAADRDDSGLIASEWLAALERQFARRGRTLVPAGRVALST